MPPNRTDSVHPEPTGEQWTISHGAQRAVVTEVGATLREYVVGNEPILDGFGVDDWSHDGRGQVLAPWPNRLGDGRYEFGGELCQAAIDEPARGNAIHGLVRWVPWRAEAHAQNMVALSYVIRPTPAYPHVLRLRVTYRVGRDGLSVSASAENLGARALPFGLGFHPYLTVGTGRVDTTVLCLPGRERLVLDDRRLPTGEVRPVAGTELDLTRPRAIGSTRLDACYTALERDASGLAWATLEAPGQGRTVAVWMDGQFGYVMCYTGDEVSEPDRRRRSVAIEPMTCPPDALRSGEGVVVLEPGERFEAGWGIRPGGRPG